MEVENMWGTFPPHPPGVVDSELRRGGTLDQAAGNAHTT